MAGFNLGDIFVTFKAKTDELKKGLGTVDREVSTFGANVKSKIGGAATAAFTALKFGALAAGAVITGLIAKFVAAGGFGRALNIEDAQAKLRGLGHDAKSVQQIMTNALAAVKGTAYSLDQAATIAASAVAAGVEPGKQLEKYLKLTADAASIAGTSLSDMGRIFNKVQATGNVFNDDLQILAEKGIPIYTWLSKQLGITVADVKDFAAEGKISSAQFRKAIETNIAGAALASGNTTRGAWENTKAAMARVGAEIANKILPKVRDALNGLTVWFDTNKANIVNGMVAIADAFKNAWNWLGQTALVIKDFLTPAFEVLVSIFNFLQPSLKSVADTFMKDMLPAVQQLWDAVVRLWNALNPGLLEALKFIGITLGVFLVAAIWVVINGLKVSIAMWSLVVSALSNVIKWVANLIGWLGNIPGAAAVAYQAVAGWFGRLPGFIGNIVNQVVNWFRAMPGRIGSVIGGIVDTIVAPFKNAFNQIADFWNKSVGSVSFKAPDWVPGIGGKGWSIPQMPHLAMGTPNWRGGMANMNEFGPETAVLPKGTRVIGADETRRGGTDAGGNTFIINVKGAMVRSESELADIMEAGIKALDRRLGGAGKPQIMGGTP